MIGPGAGTPGGWAECGLASIDRTAYPRFKRSISAQELRQAYSPSLEEMEWARGLTDTDDHLLSLVVWL